MPSSRPHTTLLCSVLPCLFTHCWVFFSPSWSLSLLTTTWEFFTFSTIGPNLLFEGIHIADLVKLVVRDVNIRVWNWVKPSCYPRGWVLGIPRLISWRILFSFSFADSSVCWQIPYDKLLQIDSPFLSRYRCWIQENLRV